MRSVGGKLKTILILLLLCIHGCAAICPTEAAKDATLFCEVMVGDRCIQYARSGSLIYGPKVR